MIWGWGDLGCYPKGTAWQEDSKTPTPHIDKLAGTGVRCSQGYTTGMVCAPSRAGLLTGRNPEKFGYFGFEDSLAPHSRIAQAPAAGAEGRRLSHRYGGEVAFQFGHGVVAAGSRL